MGWIWKFVKVIFSIILIAGIISFVAYLLGIALSWGIPIIASLILKIQDLANTFMSDDDDLGLPASIPDNEDNPNEPFMVTIPPYEDPYYLEPEET